MWLVSVLFLLYIILLIFVGINTFIEEALNIIDLKTQIIFINIKSL